MKRSSKTQLLLMSVAPLLLAACNDQDPQVAGASAASASTAATAPAADPEIVNHQYQTVDECTKAGNPQDVCQKAFEQSKQFASDAAPHFDSRDACVNQYGIDRCEERHDSSGNSFWGPMMAGFMLSQILNSGQPTYVVHPQPIYQRVGGGYYVPSSGGWGSSAGRSSSYTGTTSGWTPSNSTAGSNVVTASRGGFGSVAAARGSWGGGGSFGG